MKKAKIGILLSSVVAGLGLVGATFAAWAVTDNANPFGIKISPGTIEENVTGYSTMVLDWGDEIQFTNISNLQLGVANAQYLHVQVKSKVTKLVTTDTQTGGNLSLALQDLTASHLAGAPLLVNNLVVEVYTAKSDDPSPVYSGQLEGLTLSGNTTSANADIQTATSGAAQDIWFKVYIPDSVGAAKYNQMTSDLVYFTIDWNKPSSVTPVTTQTVYYQSESGVPNCYAYKQVGETVSKNANWPGKQMEVHDAVNHIYKYTVNMTEFTHVIFSLGETGTNQTADLEIPALSEMTPYYHGNDWIAAPVQSETQNAQYYLVGTWNAWSTDGQTPLSGAVSGVYSVEITVPAGAKYEWKVKETTSNTWYSYSSTENGAENCNWDNTEGSNPVTIVIEFSPTKTLNTGLQYVDAHVKGA